MEVYLVSTGEYSDYTIEAVFSRREDAEVYANRKNGYVEEYPVDSVKVKEKDIFEVSYEPGDVYFPATVALIEDFNYEPNYNGLNKPAKEDVGVFRSRFLYSVYVRAETREKARKKGLDLIHKKIAEDEGLT